MCQPAILTAKPMDTQQAVRVAFDELDWQQLAIFARLSPTRRFEMMFDLIEFARRLIIASERHRAPDASDDEITRRVAARIRLGYEH